MAQEVVCLFRSRTPGAEEVVSPYVIAVFACIVIVFLVERIDDRLSFRTLDVDISDWEVHVSIHGLLADGWVGDAQPLPVDRILLLAFAMLVFGDVDAVDALRGINQSFALVFVGLPFAYSQRFLGGDAESPAVSYAVFPFTLVVDVVVSYPYTIAFGLVQTVVCTREVAQGIGSQFIVDRLPVGTLQGYDAGSRAGAMPKMPSGVVSEASWKRWQPWVFLPSMLPMSLQSSLWVLPFSSV